MEPGFSYSAPPIARPRSRDAFALLAACVLAEIVAWRLSLGLIAFLCANLCLAYLGWRLHRQNTKVRRKDAEVLAAHSIIDSLVHEHWLLLTETNRVLSTSLDCSKTMQALVSLAVPALAEFSAAFVSGCGMHHGDVFVSTDESRNAEWLSRLDQVRRSGKDLMVGEAAAGAAGIVVPLLGREEIVGAIAFGNYSPRRKLGKFELNLSHQIASRVALAVDNSKLYQKARDAAFARDEMLAMVSHDIKNPLLAIDLQANLLLRDAECPERRNKLLAQIRTSVQRVHKMIEDLLDVTKIDSGQLRVKKMETALRPIVDELFETMEPLALQKQLALAMALEDPKLEAYMDRDRIFQVLQNLVGNSIKFTSEGGSVIVRAGIQGAFLRIAVEDTGVGIDEENIPHIFDRFWQGHGQTSRASAGLGLTICKGIVESHGGKIWVESRRGVGSKFIFTIPLHRAG